MNYFSILTSAGLAKLIKASANNQNIVLNQMSVSDDKAEITQDLQTLPNEKHKFNINSITKSKDDANVLICEGVIASEVGGFYVRKIGVYSDDGVLFAVGTVPESYKPLLAEGSAKDITIKFYMQVDNTANITLKVDNNVVLATRTFVNDEIDKLNNKFALKSDITDGLKIGSYLLWSSQSVTPAGFLVCDGRSLKKSEYAELFAVIGYTYGGSGDDFNIPNFSDGKFMRSIGGNAAALGEAQQDEIKSHKHYQYCGGNVPYTDHNNQILNPPAQWVQNLSITAKGWTSEVGGNETRPYNMAVVMLIKAKDVKEATASEVDKTPYATEAKAGITKLKNAITANQEDVAVTEKAVSDAIEANKGLGIGQAWQNMTTQRRKDIVYTNTTNRAIMINVTGVINNSSEDIQLWINNVVMQRSNIGSRSGYVCAVVSAGATYKITTSANGQINPSTLVWMELR
nr:MAG TPA: tail collar fiber protein [Caudoviricetes sp.]